MKLSALGDLFRGIIVMAVLAAGAGAFAQAPGVAGIAIYRDRAGQSDEFAKALPFNRMASFAVVTNFFAGGTAPTIIENSRLAAVVLFDDIATRDLIDDSDRAVLQQKQEELRRASVKFPAARAALNPVLEEISSNLLQMSNNMVRHRGAWVTAASHQAMLAKQKEAAELERQRMQAATEDRKRREENLASSRQNLAARWLLKTHKVYLSELDKVQGTVGGSSQISLPASVSAGALPLPKYRAGEVGLKEGLTATAPAILFVKTQEKCTSCRLAFTIVYDDAEIANKAELQAAASVLGQMDAGLASWLPLAVASGQTKLEFLKNSSQRAEFVKVGREISATNCELTMTPETVNDDGSVYTIATLTIR